MKIGIMTMQRIENYGSFLQALSLKRIVEDLGHEVEFVDFHPGIEIEYRTNIKEWIKFILRNSVVWRTARACILKPNALSIKYQECLPILGVHPKRNYSPKVNVLIIGSDEVFNCLQRGHNVGYALELFGKNAKADKIISYAASFGSTTYERLNYYGVVDEITERLNRFSAISVRDRNSYRIMQYLCPDKPVQMHLDPVLVGDIEKEIVHEVKRKKYIAVYGYKNRFSEKEAAAIKIFAKENALELVSVFEEQSFCDVNVICGPMNILSYISSAEYVITDTFHGTIFSIICKKQFVTFVRKQTQSGMPSNQEKLEHLLNSFGLENRCVSHFLDINVLKEPIDYSLVDQKREAEKVRTREYLTYSIG